MSKEVADREGVLPGQRNPPGLRWYQRQVLAAAVAVIVTTVTATAENFPADRFLIEAASYPARLRPALSETEIRACFLGNGSFSAEDLAGYRGPKPQSETDLSPEELHESASWIRNRSRQLAQECDVLHVPYIDVGEAGFPVAIAEARHLLLAGG